MYLIFDFDGTLVDSFETVLKHLNFLAEKFEFKKINSHEFTDLKNFSSKELIQYLKIPQYRIPMVLNYARKSLNAEILTLSPFEDIHGVLQKLYQANFSLGILTSNSVSNVNNWLTHNKLKHFFRFVDGVSHHFGKVRSISKILRKYEMDRSQAFYIGDETRDIEAAKHNGIAVIAVTWGFNSEKVLLQHQPNYIARKPKDLLGILGLSS